MVMKESDGPTNGKKKPILQLPRDVKEAVRKCREATQAALSDRISRMMVDFPVGTKFGVEPQVGGKSKKRQLSSDSSTTPTQFDLQKSDRELARIFVDMFQPVGGEHLVVAFNTVDEADAAKQQWQGDPSAASRILSLDRRRSSASSTKRNKPGAKGFAAKLAAEINDGGDDSTTKGPFQLPDKTEVALFVAPGPRERVIIERICEQVGMGTLIVLLNSRVLSTTTTTTTTTTTNFGSAAARQLFQQEFVTVFALGAAPQEAAPGCLLYRSYNSSSGTTSSGHGGDWILARKPAVGPPKTILVQATRPTNEECREALEGLELSGLEKNVEMAMENVVGWFR